ncbi:MAG: DegT/DnrJ/EryC1/StrS family aminotransferase [Clostridia bacterium]|nr:DegT/DnrJ/EryC1/StrS family aminotransferase [Clostridia bacterium]
MIFLFIAANQQLEAFKNKIWLSSPTMHWDEMNYVKSAYDSNWMSTIGENIDEIERIISQKIGRKYAVALSSGTTALHLAVISSGIKPGDNVFCSDMTFAATVNPLMYAGANPIFIDSEYETWNMCPKALRKAFEKYPDTKFVMLANLYGTPSKFDEIVSICKEHNAVLIEDAAESFGATYNGKQSGVFGYVSVISFNCNKIITGSSGGMLLTDSKETADFVRKLSTQARENAPWYQHEFVGYNYRISNVIAGVVRGQVPFLEEHISQKTELFNRYKDGFNSLPVTMNPFDENMVPNHWLSCLLIDKSAMSRQIRTDTAATYSKESGKTCPTEILETLASFNIEGRPIWKPMHLQPVYKDYPFVSVAETPVSEDVFERGLCLPSDNKITIEQQETIIEIIKHCFD